MIGSSLSFNKKDSETAAYYFSMNVYLDAGRMSEVNEINKVATEFGYFPKEGLIRVNPLYKSSY